MSCADAIATVLVSHHVVENPDSQAQDSKSNAQIVGQCPECGGPLIYQEGCNICLDCSFTKCG